MSNSRIVFAQVTDFLPHRRFEQCVHRYRGNHRVHTFSCWDQFLCMAFAQLTGRESLRDIETCLRAMRAKLYHAGIRGTIARSTLADANESRNWRIYADFAHVLISMARPLYANEEIGIQLEQSVYAFDTTTIDLCLALFPWARFRRRKGAVKLHTLMDLRGSIPCFAYISDGKMRETSVLDELVLEPGSFYVMDRGCIDFARLHVFNHAMSYFVVRAKKNLDYRRITSQAVDKSTGLRADQEIRLCGPKTSTYYPIPLRRVRYYDAGTNKSFVFLTNALDLPALTITHLYKSRWQIELFFKWIKQHLHIKAFYGLTPNAVRTQLWIAISVYVLIAIIKKRLGLRLSLNEILQILSITLFEKSPILQVFSRIPEPIADAHLPNQLELLDF